MPKANQKALDKRGLPPTHEEQLKALEAFKKRLKNASKT